MLSTYSLFYRAYGIRKKDDLLNAPIRATSELALPANSLLHFLPFDHTEVGPTVKDFLVNGKFRYVYTHHITELTQLQGEPRPLAANYLANIRDYQHNNNDLMWLRKEPAVITDTKSLIVECYRGLSVNYRYRTNIASRLDDFSNQLSTIIANTEHLLPSDRHQFAIVDVPAIFPNREQFKRATLNYTPQYLKPFDTQSLLMLLELWRWLGVDRNSSILGKLSTEAANRFNLILRFKDRCVLLNLGLIDVWRKRDDLVDERDVGSFTPEQMQKSLIKMFINLTTTDEITTVIRDTDAVAAANIQSLQDNNARIKPVRPIVDDAAIEPLVDFDAMDDEIAQHEAAVARLSKTLPESDTGTVADAPLKPPAVPYQPISLNAVEAVSASIKERVESGKLTIGEANRLQRLNGSLETLPNPFGKGTIGDMLSISSSELAIKEHKKIFDVNVVTDKTMLKSTLLEFDQRYLKEVYHKDVLSFISTIQRAGYVITDLTVKETQDVMNHDLEYSISITPLDGKSSTLKFSLPVIDEDGVMLSGGVKYYMKKQVGDMPIRKTMPHRVALTSYYGKLFIERSTQVARSYERWLCKQIRLIALDASDSRITDFALGKAFNHNEVLPRTYTALSKEFSAINITSEQGVIQLSFEYDKRMQVLGDSWSKSIPKFISDSKSVLCGVLNKAPVIMRMDGTLSVLNTADGKITEVPLGTVEEVLKLNAAKAPMELVTIDIFGKKIPLGFALAYHLGLEQLISTLGVQYRVVEANKNVSLLESEFRIKFKDESWVFSKKDRVAAMLLNGFSLFANSVSDYFRLAFQNKDTYINVLERAGMGSRYIKEIDLLFKLFVDHITAGLLEEMHEPTDFLKLLLRSTELLLTDYYPDEADKNFMRIKGYERIAGAVYNELVRSVRFKESAKSTARTALDLKPIAIKMGILTDAAKEIVNEINPVFDLKRNEVVTYGGTGGRSTKTMVKGNRQYHKTDIGLISEATVDSGMVGVITYLSADPNFKSLRGTSERLDLSGKPDVTSIMSTSALLAPCSEKDDMKRIGFVSIQGSHVISCVGSEISPITTGYEAVIPHRTTDLFAATAKQDCVVKALTDKVLTVENADGSIKSIEIGRRFGISAGSVYPFDVVTECKVGDRLKAGELLCYNKQFFAKDYMSDNGVSMKGGVVANVALIDSTDTLEDSSAISEVFARKLGTETTYIRKIVVNFDQAINGLVNAGDDVDVDSILCTIEDSVTAENNLFDAESLKALRLLSSATPRAKYKGKVDHVEVFYNGDLVDMSESLAYIANKADRSLSKLQKAMGRNAISGRVDHGYRVDGNPLLPKQLVVNVYITAYVTCNIGDKSVFGNQLKSVIGRVFSGTNETDDGVPIDAFFGYMPIAGRIVGAPEEQLTTGALLEKGAEIAVSIYEGK